MDKENNAWRIEGDHLADIVWQHLRCKKFTVLKHKFVWQNITH
jgi:hypothetical protein